MANLICLGSLALDNIKTPFNRVEDVLGGPVTHFSVAASFFVRLGIVSIAGEDLPEEHIDFLKSRNICTKGLQIVPGKTMRWSAYYEYDMNKAHTLKTELNSFENFEPNVPDEYKDAEYVFITPTESKLVMKFLNQLNKPKFIALDTKDFWIKNDREGLTETIKRANLFLLNEWEARQLFETPNLVQAAKKAFDLGPEFVIIKKGEHGSLLFTRDSHFSAPGYPLENVSDPTGAGDSFAGGFMGWLAKTNDVSESNIRKSIIYGSTVASFNAEGFGPNRLNTLTFDDIQKRYDEFRKITCFWE